MLLASSVGGAGFSTRRTARERASDIAAALPAPRVGAFGVGGLHFSRSGCGRIVVQPVARSMVLGLSVSVTVVKLEVHRFVLVASACAGRRVVFFFLVGATGLGRRTVVRSPQCVNASGERPHYAVVLGAPHKPMAVRNFAFEVLQPVGDVDRGVTRLRELDRGLSLASEEPDDVRYQVDVSAERLEQSDRDKDCLLYTSPSPRDVEESRMPSSA